MPDHPHSASELVTTPASAGDEIIVHGIDFSGGASPAAKIRIATRRPDGTIQLDRGLDHRRLVERIASAADDGARHAWRIDAPLGLASVTRAAHDLPQSWPAVAAWMASFEDPRAWRRACRAVSRKEPRRLTDRVSRTPMAPTNLRVFKQTWCAVVRVLMPLVDRGIRVEPLAGPLHARTVIAEGCPASILRAREWPARGYKGRGEGPRAVRHELVERLRSAGLRIAPPIAAQAIDDHEGDALDALVLLLPATHTVPPAPALVEGWVY